jgi:hypothetical protein
MTQTGGLSTCSFPSHSFLILKEEKVMLSRIVKSMIVCLLCSATACSRYIEVSTVDTDWMQSHVGQNVKLSGCLAFACITVPGAQYPRDCLAALSDISATHSISLEFTSDHASLRTRLDSYYPSLNGSCRPFGAGGVIVEHRCAQSDTGCVTSYGLSVTSVEAFNP